MRSTRLFVGRLLASAMTVMLPIGCAAGEPGIPSGSPDPPSEPSPTLHPEDVAGWGAFDDALLALRLRIDLLEQIGIEARDVRIHSTNATVRISGSVPGPTTAARVRELARGTRGALVIVDRLSIDAAAASSFDSPSQRQRFVDDLLAAHTRQALVRVLGSAAFDLGVEASDSHLILRGTVPDRHSRDRVIAAATGVRGVEEIHDLLRLAG